MGDIVTFTSFAVQRERVTRYSRVGCRTRAYGRPTKANRKGGYATLNVASIVFNYFVLVHVFPQDLS